MDVDAERRIISNYFTITMWRNIDLIEKNALWMWESDLACEVDKND